MNFTVLDDQKKLLGETDSLEEAIQLSDDAQVAQIAVKHEGHPTHVFTRLKYLTDDGVETRAFIGLRQYVYRHAPSA